MIRSYIIHKLTEIGKYIVRFLTIFFRPAYLANSINFADEKKFNRAADDALDSIAILFACAAIVGPVVGKDLSLDFFHESLEWLYGISEIVIIPSLFFWILGRFVNSSRKFLLYNYFHLFTYLIVSIAVTQATFLMSSMLITFSKFGNVSNWPAFDDATCLVDSSSSDCLSATSALFVRERSLDTLNGNFDLLNIFSVASGAALIILSFCTFMCHLYLLRQRLDIRYYISVPVYVVYLSLVTAIRG